MCEKFSTLQVGDVVGMIQPKTNDFNGISLNFDHLGKALINEKEIQSHEILKNLNVWANSIKDKSS
jgi:hypothetical protein